MRKLLLWIFLFSFLYSSAQDSLNITKYSLVDNNNYGYTAVTNNATQDKAEYIESQVSYVNPVGNDFLFTYNSKIQTSLTVEIFSILGQKSVSKQFLPGKGSSKFKMDVSTLPRGMYIVRFTDNSRHQSFTQKLLKE